MAISYKEAYDELIKVGFSDRQACGVLRLKINMGRGLNPADVAEELQQSGFTEAQAQVMIRVYQELARSWSAVS